MRKRLLQLLTVCFAVCMSLCLFVGCFGSGNSSGSSSDSGSGAPTQSTESGSSGSESSSASDSQSSEQTDFTAPVITINGETNYTVNAGESVTLPSATANDDVDGDITDSVYIIAASGSRFCTVEDGTFTSNVGGTHEILYCAVDAAGNDAYESVYVKVNPLTKEQELNGKNDLSVLDNGEVFVENFEKGPDSPLVKDSIKPYYTLSGLDDAISGNSLIIDYTKTNDVNGNKIIFPSTMPYLKKGVWSVSFDVKLISGVAFEDLCFAYSLNGENAVTSYGMKLPLSGMKVGEVRTLNYKAAIDVESANEGNYLFYIYYSAGASTNAKLAFDNFVFERQEIAYDTYSPSLEDLENGFTYDWSEDKYAVIGISENVDDITDETVKNELAASDEFSQTAVRLYASARINGISSTINPKYFKTGRVYTIRIPYYQKASTGPSYLSVVNGTVHNRTVGWNIFPVVGKVAVAEIRYVVKSGEEEFIIYNANNFDNLYLGNITISLKDRADVDVEQEYYTPTDEELEKGYTFDLKKGVVPELVSVYADAEYYDIAKGNIPDEGIDLSSDIFKGDYALRLGGYYDTRIVAFDGKIDENKYYRVALNVYLNKEFDANSLYLLILDANGKQIDENAATFAKIPLGGNAYRLECTLQGLRGGKFMSIYSAGEFMFYVGSIELGISDTNFVKSVTQEEVEQDGGYTLDFNNEKMLLDSTSYNLYLNETNAIEGVDESGNKYMHVLTVENTPASCLSLRSFNNVFVTGRTYTVTLKMAKGAKIPSNYLLLQADKNATQISDEAFAFVKTENEEYDEYTTTFVAKKGLAFVVIWTNGNVDFYLKSVNVTKIATAIDGKGYLTSALEVTGAQKVTVASGENVPEGNYVYFSLKNGDKAVFGGFDSFNNGKIYTVTFAGYGLSHAANAKLVALDDGGNVIASAPLGIDKIDSDGYMILSASVAADNIKNIGILVDGDGEEEAYISEVTVYEVTGGTKKVNIVANGAEIDLSVNTVDFDSDNLIASVVYVDASAYGYKTALKITADTVGLIIKFNGFDTSVLNGEALYKATVRATDLGSVATLAISGATLEGDISVVSLGDGINEYTFGFYPTASALEIRNAGETAREFCLFGLTVIEDIEDNRTEDTVTEEVALGENGYVSDFDNKKLNIVDGEWVSVVPYETDKKYLWKFEVKTSEGKYNFDPAFLKGLSFTTNSDYYTTVYFKGFVDGDASKLLLLPMAGDRQLDSKAYSANISQDGDRTVIKYVFLGVKNVEYFRVFATSADVTAYIEEIGVKTETFKPLGAMDTTATKVIAPNICDVDDFAFSALNMIILDRGKVAVIDAGDEKSDATRFILVNTLRELGVTKIDALILTHPHSDNTGAMTYLIEHFDIGKFFWKQTDYRSETSGGRVEGSYEEMFIASNKILSALSEKTNSDGSKPEKIDPTFGQTETLVSGNNTGVLTFYFNQKVFASTEAIDGNYFSMCITYSVGEHGILYAGGDLADEYTSVYADFYDPSVIESASHFAIWQANHHGSAGPYSSTSLIENIAPSYVFIAGLRSTLKDLTRDKIESYAGNADIYYACYGAVWTVDVNTGEVFADESFEHDEGDDNFRPAIKFSAADVGSEGDEGATLDINVNDLPKDQVTYLDFEYVTSIQGVDETGTTRYLHAKAYSMPTGIAFTCYRDVFVAGKTYKFTLVMTNVVSTRWFEMLFQDVSGKGQLTPQAFDVNKIDEYWSEYSVYFTAPETLSYLNLFDYNDKEWTTTLTEFYLKSINLKMINEKDIPVQRELTPDQIQSSWGKDRTEGVVTLTEGEESGVPAGTYFKLDLSYTQNMVINNMNGKITEGHYYTVSLYGYEITRSSGLNLMFFKSNFWGANAVKAGRYKDGDLNVVTATLLAGEGSAKIGFYMQDNATETMYVTKIVITDNGTKNLVTATADGFKADYTAGDITEYNHDYGLAAVTLGECDGKTALKLNSTGNCSVFNLTTATTKILNVGATYKFRFRTKDINKDSLLIAGNVDEVSANDCNVSAVAGQNLVFDFEFTFTLRSSSNDGIMFFSTSAITRNWYIFEVELTKVASSGEETNEWTVEGKDLIPDGAANTKNNWSIVTVENGSAGVHVEDGTYCHVVLTQTDNFLLTNFSQYIRAGEKYKIEVVDYWVTGEPASAMYWGMFTGEKVGDIGAATATWLSSGDVYRYSFVRECEATSEDRYFGCWYYNTYNTQNLELYIESVKITRITENA